jgi:hypothetical protein
MDDYVKVEKLAASSEYGPAKQALDDARKEFRERVKAKKAEIDAIVEVIGEPIDPIRFGNDEDSVMCCAVTGHILLDGDKVGVVLVDAVTKGDAALTL